MSRMTLCRLSFTFRGRSIERGLYAVRIANDRVRSSGSVDTSFTMSPSSDARSGPFAVGSS